MATAEITSSKGLSNGVDASKFTNFTNATPMQAHVDGAATSADSNRQTDDIAYEAFGALSELRLPATRNTLRNFGRPAWWQAHPQLMWALIASPPLLLLAVIFLYPMFGLLSKSLFAPHFTLRFYREVFGNGAYIELIWSTVRIALKTAIGTLIIGYPIAYWLTGLKGRRLQLCLAVILLPLWTSALVRNYAWILILRRGGLLEDVFHRIGIVMKPILYTETSVLIGMVFTLLPYMIFSLFNSMRAIDDRYIRAAASLGAPRWRTFRHVYLPLSMPGVTSGFLLVFIMSVGYFITPALLGGGRVQMISPEIDNQMNTLVDWNFGSALSVVLCLIVMLAVVVFVLLFDVEAFGLKRRKSGKNKPQKQTNSHATQDRHAEKAPIPIGFAHIANPLRGRATYAKPPRSISQPALSVFSLLVLFVLIAPVLIIIGTSFTSSPYLAFPPKGISLQWYSKIVSDDGWRSAAWLSFQVAFGAALVSLVLGTVAAVVLTRGEFFGKRVFNLLMIAPLVVPVIVVAVGVYFLFSQTGLLGTRWSFVLVYAMMDLPLVLLIVSSALRKTDRTPELAANTLGASPLSAFMRTTLPLISPALIAAAVFAFIHSFDDVVIAEFIAGVDSMTLPKKMWTSLMFSIDPGLSAVSTIMVFVSAFSLLVVAAVQKFSQEKK